jgi:aryl-alcohol dehydrogenase-like predicted oxidoreductase
VFLV